MHKYYKIITDNSHFADEYGVADVSAIQSGAKFTANAPFDKTVCIKSDVPVIHFSETAFETLLWYEILTKPTDKIAIYEITPVGKIVKQKCDDFRGLTQCGAPTIQIDKQISLEELIHQVKTEFKIKKFKNPNPFPDFHTANIIYQWAKDSKVI